VFFAWMGELREEAMAGIRVPLARAFGQEGKAMVTNGTRVSILRPLPFHTPLRAWIWLERTLDSQPSTFELGFQWAELGPAGEPRHIVAEGRQRLTWVGIGPGGRPLPEPYPPFFAAFMAERCPTPGTAPFTPPLGRLPRDPVAERTLWRRGQDAAREHGTARLWLETDETHSNLVGNIYFSHAATLVERACRNALRQLGTPAGGFFATALQLDHRGEAMPGDLLEAEVRLSQVCADSCAFELALFNRSQGDSRIASGLARYRLFAPAAEAGAAFSGPKPMPEWLLPHFAEETP
jgi:enediyne polyketide synthase